MVFITDEIRDKIEDLDIEQVASELGLAVKIRKLYVVLNITTLY